MLKTFVCILVVVLVLQLGHVPAGAGIIYSVPSSVYSQGFNLLPTNGSNLVWSNDSTVTGWSLFDSQTAPITSYSADDGTNLNGSFYSYGSPLNTERSLGAFGNGSAYYGNPAPGSAAGHIAVELINNTGLTLNSFFIGYMGEQWRSENPLQQTMTLEYGYGSTFAGVGTWIAPGGNFNFNGPVFGPVGVPINGNNQGMITGLGGIINNQVWANGQTLWIRWSVLNEIGGSHAFAVDNFQFQAAGVPEPSALNSILFAGVVGSLVQRRKSRAWIRIIAAETGLFTRQTLKPRSGSASIV